MPDHEPLQEVALRIERAIGNMNPTTIVEGYITAHDLYELAFAVLYHKLERVGKAGEGYEARAV